MAKKARVFEVKLTSIKRGTEIYLFAATSKADLLRQLPYEPDRHQEIRNLNFHSFYTMPSRLVDDVAFHCDELRMVVEPGEIGYGYLTVQFAKEASEIHAYLDEQNFRD